MREASDAGAWDVRRRWSWSGLQMKADGLLLEAGRTATVGCDGRGWVNARIRWKCCWADANIKLGGNKQRETRVEQEEGVDRGAVSREAG